MACHRSDTDSWSDDAFDRWVYRVGGETIVVDSIVYVAAAARGTCHSDPSTSYQYKPYFPAQYAIIGGLRQEGDSLFFVQFLFHPSPVYRSTIYAYPLDQEVLLYYFSLEKGDTIEYVTPDRKFVVENVTVNAQGRKEIQLSFGCGYPIYCPVAERTGLYERIAGNDLLQFFMRSCFYSQATGEPAC